MTFSKASTLALIAATNMLAAATPICTYDVSDLPWKGFICDSCYFDMDCLWEFYDLKCKDDENYNSIDHYEFSGNFADRFWTGDCTDCWFTNSCWAASYSKKCKDDAHYNDDEYYDL